MDMKEIGKIAKELEAEGVDLHELAKQAIKDNDWTPEQRTEAAKLADVALTQRLKKNNW